MKNINPDRFEFLERKFERIHEKLKGKTEEEIKAFFNKLKDEELDPSIGLTMDLADGLQYGTRANWVDEDYKEYKEYLGYLNTKARLEEERRGEER